LNRRALDHHGVGFEIKIKIKIKGFGLTASGFAFGELLGNSTPSNQGCLLLVWPLLRRGSFTPVLLRGPAPNGHPCPDGALAASMRLGPLRKTCAQPAPKSRLAVDGMAVYEDQKRITSRSEGEGEGEGSLAVSRLELGPITQRVQSVGPASAGKLLICFF
jgi:hypothetical protein